jgi:hypothetical protein
MPDFEWKTVAAWVGAITGTLSLLINLFSNRPRFHLARFWKPSPASLSLFVNNPSQLVVMVAGISAFPPGCYNFRPALTEASSVHDDVRHAARLLSGERVPLYLKPGESGRIDISVLRPRTVLVVVWWHRNWLFMRIPHIFWLSGRIAEDVHHAVP